MPTTVICNIFFVVALVVPVCKLAVGAGAIQLKHDEHIKAETQRNS